MKVILKLILIALPVTFFIGCYYDKEQDLYPNSYAAQVDLNNVSFSTNVQPIFNSICLSCHAAGNATPFKCDTYINVSTYLSNPANNLSCSINWNCSGGLHKMPQGGNQLSSSQITTITNWIIQGYKNN